MTSSDALLTDVAVSVRGLRKVFRLHSSPLSHAIDVLIGRKSEVQEFCALDGVTFDLRRGETLAVIGRNGSGKSTLLQLITGTLSPSSGSVAVYGRVAALLELGSGFNPEFTGLENVYLNSAIYGLSRKEVDRKLSAILEFADIGEFIHQPVKNYSSGMVVRLAFSVIAHVDADTLIIDEALSVGDAFFAQKCMRFLRDFQARGSLLLVSHDPGAVTALCQRAIWLDRGVVRMQGPAKEVMEAYMAQSHADTREDIGAERVHLKLNEVRASPASKSDVQEMIHGLQPRVAVFSFDPAAADSGFGAGRVQITDVRFGLLDGSSRALLEGGEQVVLEIDFTASQDVSGVIAGFYLKDRLGQRLFGENSYEACKARPVELRSGDRGCARFEFRMPALPSGDYLFDVAVASGTQNDHTQQHWIVDALQIRGVDETQRFGLVGIPMSSITVQRVAGNA